MRPCPACGETTAAYSLGLQKCRSCGLCFKNKKSFNAPLYSPGMEADIYRAAKNGLFAAALDFLGRGQALRGRLLDIGCAGGEFMKAALERGWRPEGVEIDPVLSARAAAAGFRVHVRAVEECSLEGGGYTAVTAFEVLSQMDAPDAAVRESYKLLAPGGVIYVREFNAVFHVPLYKFQLSGIFGLLGARPAVLHNFNFTPHAIRIMLQRAGFTDIAVRNSRPTAGDPYRTGGLIGGRLAGLLKFLYYLLAQALWLLSFGRLYAGSALIVTARK